MVIYSGTGRGGRADEGADGRVDGTGGGKKTSNFARINPAVVYRYIRPGREGSSRRGVVGWGGVHGGLVIFNAFNTGRAVFVRREPRVNIWTTETGRERQNNHRPHTIAVILLLFFFVFNYAFFSIVHITDAGGRTLGAVLSVLSSIRTPDRKIG